MPMYNERRIKSNKLKHKVKNGPNIISQVFSDYLNNSTIHGISYLGAKDKNLIEKIWWILGLIVSVTACTYFINKTWTKWEENPVMVSFAQKHTPIWEIPFPAVTVCPLNKIKQSKYNYTEFNSYCNQEPVSRSQEECKQFWDISFICDRARTFQADFNQANITDTNIINNIQMVSPPLFETVNNPYWARYPVTHWSFMEHITSEGLCFTFNEHSALYTEEMQAGLVIKNINSYTSWSMENGFTEPDMEYSYPFRTAQVGLNFGLYFELASEPSDMTKYCGDEISGYKMVLHNLAEIPKVAENYFLVPVNQRVIVAVTPKVIRTSQNLVDIPPHTRNCFFDHEKKLRFYTVYTQYNCKTECLSNVTREHCGCVPFDLPRDNNTEICGFGKMLCLRDAKAKAIFETFKTCDCLVSCNYIDYEFDLSQADYIYNNLSWQPEYQPTLSDKTPVNIYFKESEFLAIERNELYGQTDFIANIGGLLGLCMGFSFLSLLEILYYITLRMWCKLYNRGNINETPKIEQKTKIPRLTSHRKLKNESVVSWIS